MSSKVLVTGGAGFIGSHVTERLLEDGYSVRVVDNLSSGNLANISTLISCGSVDFVRADLRDRDVIDKLVHGVETVIHLAGIVSVPFSLEKPRLTYEVNVEGTKGLISSCVRNAVKKFVFVSSCSVYGSPRYLPVDEGHPTAPISPYAFSKLEGEHFCQAFIERRSLNVIVLRLFNVYGPRQASGEYSGVIQKFLENAEKGHPLVIYGDGTQTRDFVHVIDVANAITTLVHDTEIQGVYNVGSGKSVSIGELAKAIMSLSGEDYGITFKKKRVGDIAHSIADTSKAQKAFAYAPRTSLENGLQELWLERMSASL